MLQCVAVCWRMLQSIAASCIKLQCVEVCCSALQCVIMCCSVLQCVAVCCSVLQDVAAYCGVLQCVVASRDLISQEPYFPSFMCDVTHSNDMTHSHVTRLIHMFHVSFTCGVIHSPVAWLTHVWHDTFTCNLIHSRVEWHIHASHASFIPSQNKKVTRQLTKINAFCYCWPFFPWYRIWMHRIWAICDMTHTPVTWLPQVRYDSFTCDMTYSYVTRLIRVYNAIYSCATWLSVIWLIHVWHVSLVCHRLIHTVHLSLLCQQISCTRARARGTDFFSWRFIFFCFKTHNCIHLFFFWWKKKKD